MDFDKCHLCRSWNPPYERDAATFDLKISTPKDRLSSTITVGLTSLKDQNNRTRDLEQWSRNGEIHLPKITKVCQIPDHNILEERKYGKHAVSLLLFMLQDPKLENQGTQSHSNTFPALQLIK